MFARLLSPICIGVMVLGFGVGLAGAVGSPTGRGADDAHLLLAKYRRPGAAPATGPAVAAQVELGKSLFFDPRLSGSGVISCASCHNPARGWQDGLATARGDRGSHLPRHTPTIIDVAWVEPLFWDGRADTLEDQAKGPLTSAAEMNMPDAKLVSRVASIPGYVRAFHAAFPGEPITLDTVAKAIAAFERTVVSGTAPFDRWVAGDEGAVSERAKRGFALFNGAANCASCHSGWRLTDDGFHDIGLPDADPGRSRIVPGVPILDHAFKTPTLRNIADRGPYMHDGSIGTLEAVVDHYDHGFASRPSLATQIKPLHLTADEKADLVAYLRSLSSDDGRVTPPILPR